jgi:hypothetical protein
MFTDQAKGSPIQGSFTSRGKRLFFPNNVRTDPGIHPMGTGCSLGANRPGSKVSHSTPLVPRLKKQERRTSATSTRQLYHTFACATRAVESQSESEGSEILTKYSNCRTLTATMTIRYRLHISLNSSLMIHVVATKRLTGLPLLIHIEPL